MLLEIANILMLYAISAAKSYSVRPVKTGH